MPTISVKRDDLFKAIRRKYKTDEEFDKLCYQYGLELVEVTSEKEQLERVKGVGKAVGASEAIEYQIKIPAKRYDLLCIKGLFRGLRILFGIDKISRYKAVYLPQGKVQRRVMQPSEHRNQGNLPTVPDDVASAMSSIFPEMSQTFSKEVKDRANTYFQQIYSQPPAPTMSIDEVLAVLKSLKDSHDKTNKDVLACMLRNLFEEYRFLHLYPDRELQITAQLFGGIIEKNIFTYWTLGIALRHIREALRKQPNSKLYLFGVSSLERFKTQLKHYPQFCQDLSQIPHFMQRPPHLIEYVAYGARSQEPPHPLVPQFDLENSNQWSETTVPEGPATAMSRIFPAITQTFSREVEDRANTYFQQIYSQPPAPTMSIDEVLAVLKSLKDSDDKTNKDVFACMLRNLFKEYRFLPLYPDRELQITAQLFGGVIEQYIVTRGTLAIALRHILKALRKQPNSKLYLFGVASLERFKSNLKHISHYCRHLSQIPHFMQLPPHLIEYVAYGARSQEPPHLQVPLEC